MTSERELAARFGEADDAVLRDVYARYGGPVFTVTLSILGDAGRAAEAAQATFVNAWRAAERFDSAQPLGPWLYTIARRAAIDVYRRDRRLELVDPGEFDGRQGHEDASLESTWEAWQVRLAIDDLPGEERDVVRLSWYDGLTHPEISERLGVPVGTVKSRSHRAHRRLAAALAHVRDANRTPPSDVVLGEVEPSAAADTDVGRLGSRGGTRLPPRSR